MQVARRIGVLLILCIFSGLAVYPLYRVPEWYASHEMERYLFLMKEFRLAFDNGMWYPRWAARLFNGYGYPTFLFYQPGVFFFLLPFTYLPLPLTAVFKMAIFSIFLLSAGGCYLIARFFGIERFSSALSSAVYLSLPYVYINLYVRCDLSEFFAMMLCPWVMLGVLMIECESAAALRWHTFCLYVLAVSAICVSHPNVMMFIVPIIGWFAVIDWIADGRRSHASWVLLFGGIVAGVLTSPYWLTVFQLAPYVALGKASFAIQEDILWYENFFMFDPPRVYPWWILSTGMASLFYMVLALAGLMLAVRKRLFWQVTPLLIATIYMNTKQSAPVWENIPEAGYIQFPWRIFSVLGILQYVGVIQLVKQGNRLPVALLRVSVVAMVVAGFFAAPLVTEDTAGGYSVRFFSQNLLFSPLSPRISYASEDRVAVNNIFANVGEFTPRTVSPDAPEHFMRFPDEEATLSLNTGVVHVDESVLPYHMRGDTEITGIQVPPAPKAVDELPFITMKRIYLPGWAIWVNGERVAIPEGDSWRQRPTMAADPMGRIRVYLPKPGHYAFDAYYEGPPNWQWRNLAMYASMILLCWVIMRLRLVRTPAFLYAASVPK